MSAWLDVMRAACAASSQAAVAKRLHYSTTVINQVLSGKYTGDLRAVQTAVEGAFMGGEVDCPVIGTLPLQRCVEHQRSRFSATNPMRVQLAKTCPVCPHNLNAGKPGKEQP